MAAKTHAFDAVEETTAAEVSRNFGHWQDRALQRPVQVTHHGRPRVVILSTDAFERLSATPSLRSEASADPAVAAEAETALIAMAQNMSEGFLALDEKLRITAVNAATEAFTGKRAEDLLGRPVGSFDGRPINEVLIDRYRWVLRTGEIANFQASGYPHPGRTVNIHAFPYRGGVGVLFTNRTEITLMRQTCEEASARQAAFDAHGEVLSANLNALGFIVSANLSFTEFLGFSSEQLSDVRLADLVSASDRMAFNKTLNTILRGDGATATLEVDFLTRNFGRRPVRLAIAPIMRDLVYSGFMVVGLSTPL